MFSIVRHPNFKTVNISLCNMIAAEVQPCKCCRVVLCSLYAIQKPQAFSHGLVCTLNLYELNAPNNISAAWFLEAYVLVILHSHITASWILSHNRMPHIYTSNSLHIYTLSIIRCSLTASFALLFLCQVAAL